MDMKKAFRLLGIAEAISFLALLFIAMPLKYFWGMPNATQMTGAIHGGLFLAYLYAAWRLGVELKWPPQKIATAWVAAVLPFGPIIFDRKLLVERSQA